ncbi:MAG: TetR/AcrR family transcriptional regulator [Actinobacteria bacterium]|nr:TetR/AcrR family transcriptional regulator [Actinomycetota bacterium]
MPSRQAMGPQPPRMLSPARPESQFGKTEDPARRQDEQASSRAAKTREPPRAVKRAMNDEDKEHRRTEILSAAKVVFATKGFHATTIADIARQAKLSYGSIYWYFDSKDGLFHTLMEVEGEALRDHINQALASTPASAGPQGPFRAAVQATFEFFEADKALVKLLFRDSYALGDRFEKHLFGIYEEFISDIEVMVRSGQKAGIIADYPPRMVAFAIAALIGQIAHRRLVTDDGLEAGVVAELVVSLLLNGLLPRDRTSFSDMSAGLTGAGVFPRPKVGQEILD